MPQKTFIIYTATDKASRRLKSTTQILLTLTPVDQTNLFKSQTPIAWQVISFEKGGSVVKRLKWNTEAGFSSVSVKEDIVQPQMCQIIKPGKVATFATDDELEQSEWSELQDATKPGKVMQVRNATGIPQTFALCSVADGKDGEPDDEDFEPVLRFELPADKEMITSQPVMVQAYAVSGYKKGQLVNKTVHANPLFLNWANKPDPVDISKCGERPTCLLYSSPGGKVVLTRPSG